MAPLDQGKAMPGSWESPPPTDPEASASDSCPGKKTISRAAPKPLISIMKPSEPVEPNPSPRYAQLQGFYCDLIRGFTDFIVGIYRVKYLPKLEGNCTPGMFVLKRGPYKEYKSLIFGSKGSEEAWLSRQIACRPAMRVQANDTTRPVLSVGADFWISVCPDELPPPSNGNRKLASLSLSVGGVGSPLRRTFLPLPNLSPRSSMPFIRSPQNSHEGHSCVDIERLAREFMWWFLEWRATIPRKISKDLDIDSKLDNFVRSYIDERLQDGNFDTEKFSKEYKQALYNLIWELRHPEASRPGTSNPNGKKLAHPWIHGNEYIHGVCDLARSSETFGLMRISTCMNASKQDRKARLTATNGDWHPDLFSLLGRQVAPQDNGAFLRWDELVESGRKRYYTGSSPKPSDDGRKRRMLGNGTFEESHKEGDAANGEQSASLSFVSHERSPGNISTARYINEVTPGIREGNMDAMDIDQRLEAELDSGSLMEIGG